MTLVLSGLISSYAPLWREGPEDKAKYADICVAIRLEGELHAWWGGGMFGPADVNNFHSSCYIVEELITNNIQCHLCDY